VSDDLSREELPVHLSFSSRIGCMQQNWSG
jgi:hypothetical protein